MTDDDHQNYVYHYHGGGCADGFLDDGGHRHLADDDVDDGVLR